jgi:hypothetical protein
LSSLEEIVLSPAFAVLLAIVGAYLFVIISREFFLWFFKLTEINAKLKTIDERLADIEQSLQNNRPAKIQIESDLAQLPPTVGLQEKDSQFPLTH